VLEQPFRFQGQQFDEETGLHYNRHRYYDPGVGRFVSQDPIGLLGGSNLFAYAPNPLGWVDPAGLQRRKNKKKCKSSEKIYRRMNKKEAQESSQAGERGGLVPKPKPHQNSPKWVTTKEPQKSLAKQGHEKTVIYDMKTGTTEWLESLSQDFDSVEGEKDLPCGVLTKTNEGDAMGIGSGLIDEFNSKVLKVTIK
jgi:RHS repeat-associated protein